MKSRMYGLLAETPIHPGSGKDGGLIDQPVAREAITDYPVVVGSAFKGALKEMFFWDVYVEPDLSITTDEEQKSKLLAKALKDADQQIEPFFGASDAAGAILVSDVRLLLLPVRSLNASYYWVTCPHILERLQRDLRRLGASSHFDLPRQPSENMFAGNPRNPVFLEERKFSSDDKCSLSHETIEAIGKFVVHDSTRGRLSSQVILLNDKDFSWFARYGLAVTARNSLDRETKASKNLWYEETIPCDSLFYSILAEREQGKLDAFHQRISKSNYIRVGGNETVGQGWFAVHSLDTNLSSNGKNTLGAE